MAAREIIVLNEATNELQAPQGGDTYVANKPVHFALAVTTGSTVNGRTPAADAALLDSALQPGEAATPAQGTAADTAVQPGDLDPVAFTGSAEDLIEGVTKLLMATAERVKLGFITVTQPVNLDTMEADLVAALTKLGFITVTQAVDLDALEASIPALAGSLSPVATSGDSDDLTEGAVNLLMTPTERAALTELSSLTIGIVAFAGGGQASATLLVTRYNIVDTVGTAGDSVRLPTSAGGHLVVVKNTQANSLNVFPGTGAKIDTGAVNAAVAVPSGFTKYFFSTTATQWETLT